MYDGSMSGGKESEAATTDTEEAAAKDEGDIEEGDIDEGDNPMTMSEVFKDTCDS